MYFDILLVCYKTDTILMFWGITTYEDHNQNKTQLSRGQSCVQKEKKIPEFFFVIYQVRKFFFSLDCTSMGFDIKLC